MLNIAIVGTGNISRMHIEAYKAFPERCKIVALVDIVPEKAWERKKLYDLNEAEVYSSHKDILDIADIDLVSVCTPPFCHAEITIDCLNSGKNVLVEKPMAVSLEECDAMIEAERKSGKTLSVVAQNRFRDPIMNLKKTLDSGLLGRVLHAQVDSFWWRGHSYYDLWWRGLWEKEGGGCTLNHAVHHIDMLGWIMGEPKTVTAILSNAAHDNSEVEDVSVAVLEYDKGALAQITSSVIHHGEEQQLIFQAEKARISAPLELAACLSSENGFPSENSNIELMKQIQDYYDSLPSVKYTAHDGQIENVLTAIETGQAPLITGKEGRLTIGLISAIYKAGSEKRTVDYPITKDDAFYTAEGILKSVPRFFKKTASLSELSGDITVGNDYKNVYKMGGK